MAKNKKPRKKYRPTGAILDPLAFLARVPAGDRTKTQATYHFAMRQMSRGEGTLADWRLIAACINTGSILDEFTFQGEFAEAFAHALEAHQHCGARAVNQQRFLYRGAELSAVNLALEIHDEQLKVATRREIELAKNEVQERSKHPHTRLSAVALAEQLAQGKTQ